MEYRSHKDICEYLRIPRQQVTKYPWIVRATVIHIFVEGDRKFCFGGATECSKCGYGVDGLGDKSKCPKCGHK